MATITIKNVGPIKEAELTLNKVNVFMGPQSSGKSTIAKIISYCTWVEKRRRLDGFFRDDFLGRLKIFHNLDDTYFISDDAYIRYDGNYCDIEFSKKNPEIKIIVKNDATHLELNRKLIFIPAERNFVASIPNLGRYKETNNNVMNFLYDWYEAKKHYTKDNILNIPALGISFYHIENEDKDVIVLDEGKEIILQNASSGIQSLTPLYLLMDYLTNILYKKEIIQSPFEKKRLKEMAKPMMETELQRLTEPLIEQTIQEIEERQGTVANISREDEILLTLINLYKKGTKDELFNFLIDTSINYQNTQFIIEEPEQNLFPEAQRDLVYHLLHLITGERDHRLTITTHSPYILYALNNCMLGGLVYDKMDEEDKNRLKCQSSLINPNDVSAYEIHDGILKSIQQEDKLIGANFFDKKMKEIMDDFYVFLNYYGE